MHDPILHLLGLCKKAGRLEIGEEPVGAACRSRKAKLLLLASDASSNTCRRAAHFGEAGKVLFLQLPQSKAELGIQLGRTSVAMLAVTDAGFAGTIGKRLAQLDPVRYGPAAAQLQERADRILQRQKEQRRHEKKLLQQSKGKPWVPPPKKGANPSSGKAGQGNKKKSPASHSTSQTKSGQTRLKIQQKPSGKRPHLEK